MTDTTIGGIATTATNLTLADLIEIEQGGVSKQAALGLLLGLLFDSDDTLVGDSDDVAPTQKAVKAFVENAIAAITTGGASIGVQFLADTGSTADSDPGAGLLKWNHATQTSATVIYLDDASADGASLTAIWPRLNAGGVLFLQHATNQDIWQIWEFTAINDASGYAKLTVTLWAAAGTFADNDPILVTLDKGQGAGSVSSVNGASGTVDTFGTGLDVDATGFRGLPQNSQSGNYTCVAADSGKQVIHPSGAGAGDTFTIPANASVAFEIGTAITFINMDSNALSIAITTDTLNLAGAGTTGTRTLAQYGVATAVKVGATQWLISGVNLT